MIEKDVNKFCPKICTDVFYSQVQNKGLFNIKPNFNSRAIICLGIKGNDRKGTSIQVKVGTEFPNQMYILGNYNYMKKIYLEYKDKKNIRFVGLVKPQDYFGLGLFLLHPAKFDAGPNAVTEAMAAGLIPIISYRTGRTEMVKEVKDDLVVNSFNFKDYYSKINELTNLSENDLKILSYRSRQVAKKYYKRYTISNFNLLFIKLIRKCQRN